MLVRFWGTRGSLPVSMTAMDVRAKVINALVTAKGKRFESVEEAERFVDGELDFTISGTYGGATSCIEIDHGEGEFLVCDMGSGFRDFGLDAMKRTASERPKVYNIFMSHMHWDHIMGFPFFVPAFIPGNRIKFHGGHPTLELALRRQQEKISFPVPLDFMNADMAFSTLALGEDVEVAGTKVSMIKQLHDNDSFGYRFERNGKIVVYSTDSEHKIDDVDSEDRFVEFFRDADLVIFDTMYSLADAITLKEDWGHSSGVVAVDLCHRAGVRKLAMYHHEPAYNDQMVDDQYRDVVRYEALMRQDSPLEVICAYDGLEIVL